MKKWILTTLILVLFTGVSINLVAGPSDKSVQSELKEKFATN